MRFDLDDFMDMLFGLFTFFMIAFLIFIIPATLYSSWKKATAEKEIVNEIHVIVDKEIEKTNRVQMVGKTTTVIPNTDYYLITDEGIKLKTSKSAYDKYNLEDSIIIQHIYYKKEK